MTARLSRFAHLLRSQSQRRGDTAAHEIEAEAGGPGDGRRGKAGCDPDEAYALRAIELARATGRLRV